MDTNSYYLENHNSCKYCGSNNLKIELLNCNPHCGKSICGHCGRHQKWLSKKFLIGYFQQEYPKEVNKYAGAKAIDSLIY